MSIHHLCSIFAIFAFVSPALAAPAHDDAISENGASIVSRSGECVRTKWVSANDPCAPEPPPVQKIVHTPAPMPQIAQEERTVYFGFNESTLTAEGEAKLNALVNTIQRSQAIRRVTILGYADEIGKTEANVILSGKRAETVQKYLSARISIPTNVLMVDGKGEINSVTNCAPEMKRKERIACLAKDRRVEVVFNYLQE